VEESNNRQKPIEGKPESDKTDNVGTNFRHLIDYKKFTRATETKKLGMAALIDNMKSELA
jgi:hypothetical protein